MRNPLIDGLLLGCKPRENLSILDFAERHVMLPHSDKAKSFSRKTAPHLVPIFEAVERHDLHDIVVCAPTGCGKTTFFEVLAPYIVAQEPGPTMIVFQSDSDAKDWAEGRLQGVLGSCDVIAPLFSKDRHAKRKTAIYFPHMFMLVEGANINNLQAKSLRWAIGDEVWIWDKGLVNEFRRRLHDREIRKFILMGQAGEEGDDFHTAEDECSKHEFQFECPHCKTVQPWRLEQVKYERPLNPDGTTNWPALIASVHMLCKSCGARFDDDVTTRRTLAESGRSVKVSDGIPDRWGYTFPAFAVWWIKWADLIVEWVKANDEAKKGDTTSLRQFKQKRLAQRWEEQGSRATDEAVLQCRGEYLKGTCPIEPAFVTVCTDTGERMTHWSACAWTTEGEAFVFDYGTVLSPEEIIEEISGKIDAWRTPSGQLVQVQAGLMDSGFWSERIYAVCARSGGILWPSKGSPVEFGTWAQSEIADYPNLRLYTYRDYQAKSDLYLWKIGQHAAPRLWIPKDSSEDFLTGHMGQRLVVPKGAKKKEFAKVAADHYGDCSKLHRVCWWILGKQFTQ